MTSPQNPFGGNPFEAPVQAGPPSYAPPLQGAPLPTGGGEVNTLATLSVVFAFVLAPLGALFGHLGLGQIARSGQRGRERALVGVTLSYVFIAVAVVGVIAWATLGSATGKGPKESAAPSDPVPVTSTTTTPAPPSTVAAADLAGLLPDLVELKSLTGQQRLSPGQIYTVMSADGTTTDPPDCASLSGAAIPETYDQNVVTGSYGQVFNGPSDPMQPVFVNPNVVAFPDAAAAQAQVRLLKAAWQRCAESTITVNYPTVGRLVESVGKPVDAGNGITALEVELPKGAGICVRTIAAKGNVVVDDYLTTLSADVPHAVALTNAILAKIPG